MSLQSNYKGYNIPNVETFSDIDEKEEKVVKSQPSVDEQINTLMPSYASSLEGDEIEGDEKVLETTVKSDDDDKYSMGIIPQWMRKREAEAAFSPDVMKRAEVAGISGVGTQAKPVITPPAEQARIAKKEAEQKQEAKKIGPKFPIWGLSIEDVMKTFPHYSRRQAIALQNSMLKSYDEIGGKVSALDIKTSERTSMPTFGYYPTAMAEGISRAIEGLGLMAAYTQRLPGIFTTFTRTEGAVEPSLFLKLTTTPAAWNQDIARFHEKMGKRTISDMKLLASEMPSSTEKDELIQNIQALETIEGPNALWEIQNKLFNDAAYKLTFIDDVRNFGKVYYPQMLGDAAADLVYDGFKPVYEFLEIPEDQKNMFHEALTFGSSMVFGVPLRFGANAFRLGATTVGRGAQQAAKLGMSNAREGGKIYNVLKPFTERMTTTKGPWGDTPMRFNMKKAAKDIYKVPLDVAKIDAKLFLGSTSGYATGEALFGGGEYDSLKYVMGLAGGISSLINPLDPTMKGVNGAWRFLTGIAHATTAVPHRLATWSKAVPKLTEGQIYGWSDVFLLSRGFSIPEIKGMYKEAGRMYDEVIATPNGIEKAKEMGLAISDGRGGYKANANFIKRKYYASSKKEIEFYGQILKQIDEMDLNDPSLAGFKRDLKTNMERGYGLFEKLSRGLKGEDRLEKMQVLGATITDLIALNNIRNYQAAMISKLNLGMMGGFKRGKLVSELEKVDRQLDYRIDAFKEALDGFNLGSEAENIHRELQNTFRGMLKESIEARAKNKRNVSDMLSRLKSKVLQKYLPKDAQAANQMKETLRIGEHGPYATPSGVERLGYNSDNFLYGRANKDGTWAEPRTAYGLAEHATYTRTGLYYQKRNVSDDLYANAFKLTRGDDGEILFHVDATPLFARGGALESGGSLNASLQGDIASSFTREAERAVYKNIDKKFTEAPLILSFRRRGLQAKRKELGEDGYKDYLDEVLDANPQFSYKDAKGKGRIDSIEDALLNYDGPLNNVPALMTVEEWHFLRSRLRSMSRNHFRQGSSTTGDMTNYHASENAVNTFEELFTNSLKGESANIGGAVKDALNVATKNYNKTMLPWHSFRTTRWLKDDGTMISSAPENYFMSFFSGGASLQEANARGFKQMFLNPQTGKLDTEAVGFLRQALGKAFHDTDGNIAGGRYRQLEMAWKPIFKEKYGSKEADEIFKTLKKSSDFKEEIFKTGNPKFFKDQMDRVETSMTALKNWFTTSSEDAANILSKSVWNKLSGELGADVLPASMPEFITALGKGDGLMQRSTMYDLLIGMSAKGERAGLSKAFGMVPERRLERLRDLQAETRTVTGEVGDAGRVIERDLMTEGKKILPPRMLEEELVDKPLNIFIRHLDEQVATGAMTSEKVESILDGVRTMLVEEMIWRNIKHTKQLKLTGADQRASMYGDKMTPPAVFRPGGEARKITEAPPIIDLRQEIDIVNMRKTWNENLATMEVLYNRTDATRKQYQHLTEMMELSINIYGKTGVLNVVGGVGEYTFSMAMGRMYNAMKGVMSVRYMIMEGGAIQARRVQAEMFMKLFTDPSAALIARDIFMSSKPSTTKIQRFKKILERSMGYELSEDENKQLMATIQNSSDWIIRAGIYLETQSREAPAWLELQQMKRRMNRGPLNAPAQLTRSQQQEYIELHNEIMRLKP